MESKEDKRVRLRGHSDCYLDALIYESASSDGKKTVYFVALEFKTEGQRPHLYAVNVFFNLQEAEQYFEKAANGIEIWGGVEE